MENMPIEISSDDDDDLEENTILEGEKNNLFSFLETKKLSRSLEAPSDVVSTPLYPHQKEALSWLYDKENGEELPPFWEEREWAYVNTLSNTFKNRRPEPIRGGIFADEMGLGKTLAIISLLALDIFPPEEDSFEFKGKGKSLTLIPVIPASPKRPRIQKDDKNINKSSEKEAFVSEGTSFSAAHLPSKAAIGVRVKRTITLIICPSSVRSTWIQQFAEHTKEHVLRVCDYYGPDRPKDPSHVLKNYDVVITTYKLLTVEATSIGSPIKEIDWWRVVLDEGHILKNSDSQQSCAACLLKADRKWVVTGTPIQSGWSDLFGAIAFLRIQPLSRKKVWQVFLQDPIHEDNEASLVKLKELMATIMLRRRKEGLIDLPAKVMDTYYVLLSEEEREKYFEAEKDAKVFVEQYISSSDVRISYPAILAMLLRLRQMCTDSMLGASLHICIRDLSDDNPELLGKMLATLEDEADLDCPICLCTPKDIVITSCSHILCKGCILKILQSTSCCPLCRRHLSEVDVFSAPPNITGIASASNSSKIAALLRLLKESRDEQSVDKSVIFSHSRQMLMVVEKHLMTAGFSVVRLDSSMDAKRRGKILNKFRVAGPTPEILLASLKAAGTGINLTMASRVFVLEPWWNPTLEEQAIDRVHRIGQESEVRIVRLIAKDTIEERILELQQQKKKQFLGTDAKKGHKEISISDLKMLMHM